eukprot:7730653-Pyramimonas_sp.AAC.1
MGQNDVAPATVDAPQRGGVRGRNIIDNVVEAAFPSILAEWIFAASVAAGVPSGAVGFFKALCVNNAALVCVEGAAETVCPVERGVRQGDP